LATALWLFSQHFFCWCTMRAVVAFSLVVAEVSGHGAIVSPRSRNSIDYLVGVNVPEHWPADRGCVNITGGKCNNGQAPFWYSQGCFIGCDTCDHLSGRQQTDLCGSGAKRTIDEKFRTCNLDAVPGSPQDIYRHNPWSAPGTAPVANPCGLAGGTPWAEEVSEAGDYTATKYAHHGMRGTELPSLNETEVKWTTGGQAEVTHHTMNNHGGGYHFRLCPAEEELSEDCFQRHPLDFVQDQQGIVFENSTVLPISGKFVNKGTFPVGSMWSAHPIPATWFGPRCLPGPNDTADTPNACEPWEKGLVEGECKPCPETPGSDCSRCDNTPGPSFPPPCEGCQGSNHHIAIRDVVQIPADLKPGKYILGWRWDCEATAQVWSGCSDVTLVAPESIV